jgi:hypothetical protein
VLKFLPKSYKRITWYEIVILYGRLELLLTGGCVYGELDGPTINAFNVEDLDSLLQKIRDATADRNTSIVFDGEDVLNYLEQLSNICARKKEEMLALDATITMIKGLNLSQFAQSIINGKVVTSLYTNLALLQNKQQRENCSSSIYELNDIKLLSYTSPSTKAYS